MKTSGSYVLLITLPDAKTVSVGRLGPLDFAAGHYAYAGSAMNGLYQRVNRHLRREKKIRWHIDYLLKEAPAKDVIICESEDRTECLIAGGLAERFEAVKRFGSSDCKCSGHLFYSDREMKTDIMSVLQSLGLPAKEYRDGR